MSKEVVEIDQNIVKKVPKYVRPAEGKLSSKQLKVT